MTRYAFVVATDKYSNFGPTAFCHRDADLLAKTLVDSCDYASQDVVVELLAPETPTSPATILDKLKALVARTSANDTILLFYAGHGTTVDGEPHLVLPQSDLADMRGTTLPLRSISDVLRVPQRVCVRIFDACQSGADVRSVLDVSGFARAVAATNHEGWFTFAACGEAEFSYPDPNRQQGVFTARLCDAIRESAAGVEVLPERIKIAVCEKVETWCQAEGRRQTPQFNSAISGNISFATRKAASAPAPTREAAPQLNARLARLRGEVPAWVVSGPEHRAAVKADAEVLRKAVENALTKVDACGATVEPVKIRDPDGFPEAYTQRLVRTLLGLGLKCLHEAKEERRVVEQPRPLLSGMFYEAPPPKVYKDYSLLSGNWPPSVVLVSVKSPDGLLPSGCLFFYLAPFQVVSGLLIGYGVTGPSSDPSAGPPPVDVLSVDKYMKPGADNAAVMQATVAAAVQAFNERFQKAATQRVAYLEEELARIK